MKFTTQEIQKTTERLLEGVKASKRALPIRFEMNGRIAEPRLAILNKPDEEEYKITSVKSYNVDIGTDNAGLKASLKTETMAFLDSNGVEQLIDIPQIENQDLVKLFQAAEDLTRMLIAVRNAVILTAATEETMVMASSLEPMTGIILADALAGDGRIQQSTVKDIIEQSEMYENGKMNSAISEYNANKMAVKASDAVTHAVLTNFADGCKDLKRNYEKLVSKSIRSEIQHSEADPVIVQRREASLEQIERVEKKKKTLSSLI
ncbi:MAG: hypothetical protein ACRCX2_28095 [Paraclostridium sp.]